MALTTTSQTLDQAYFAWLYDQVRPQHSQQVYEELCWALYKKEFVPIIFNDDNRVEDAHDLLVEFFRERHDLAVESERVDGNGCSCLELVVVLSRLLAFVAGGGCISWAWILLGNLGFHSLSDPLDERNLRFVDGALEKVIWRTYRENGVGGFFPLHNPQEDQRKVELWYQMNAYAYENPVDL